MPVNNQLFYAQRGRLELLVLCRWVVNFVTRYSCLNFCGCIGNYIKLKLSDSFHDCRRTRVVFLSRIKTWLKTQTRQEKSLAPRVVSIRRVNLRLGNSAVDNCNCGRQWEISSLICVYGWASCANAWEQLEVGDHFASLSRKFTWSWCNTLASFSRFTNTSPLSSTHKLAYGPHFLTCDYCYYSISIFDHSRSYNERCLFDVLVLTTPLQWNI